MKVHHRDWCRQRRKELLATANKSDDRNLEIETLNHFIKGNLSDAEFEAKLAKRIRDTSPRAARSRRVCRRILSAWDVASGEIDSGIEPSKMVPKNPPSLTQNLHPKPGTIGDPEVGGWRPLNS